MVAHSRAQIASSTRAPSHPVRSLAGSIGDQLGEPRGLVEDIHGDLKAGGELPREKTEDDGVDGDVSAPGRVVALLHLGDKSGCHGPEHRDASTSEKVGPREELPGTEVGVAAALDREGHTESQEGRGGRKVLVLVVARDQLLPLGRLLIHLSLEGADLGGGGGLGVLLSLQGFQLLVQGLEIVSDLPDLPPHEPLVAREEGEEKE
mmetsp:Transcript_29513/g.74804  ORF Transcript_29513/g.74804 Transcript_29513/m.74804 type:complete len:206 (+) Transcript_29513:381-998(+)